MKYIRKIYINKKGYEETTCGFRKPPRGVRKDYLDQGL